MCIVNELGLHCVEHPSFFVKNSKDFFCFWMISWDNNRNVLFGSWFFSFHLNSSEIIAFLLSSLIKPIREKSCSLCLLLTSCAAHVKQYVRICAEELVYYTKHSLHDFNIIRRRNMVKVGEIKPIGLKKRMFFYFKIDSISTSFVRFKIKNLTPVPDFECIKR